MIEIIPAIDIIGGKCVRLRQGDFSQATIYNENPVEAALRFEDAGLRHLHLVDLDGARMGMVKNWKTLEQIAGKTKLVIDFSGGVSSKKNVKTAIDSGATYVAAGSIAVQDEPEFDSWLLLFGAEKFIIAADVKNEKIVIRGWTETTSLSVFDLIERWQPKGIKQFFCTDTGKDGLLEGSSIDLYKKIIEGFPGVHLIASGGVSSIEEVEKLQSAGCSGVIIGKALYENRVSLNDLKKFV